MTKRLNPKLWNRIKQKWMKSNKGGKPGKWSARKAQFAVKDYIDQGGKYEGPKDPDNALTKWTREDWGYIYGDETGRYLPKAVRDHLTEKEKKLENKLKREATKKGKPKAKYSESVLKKFRERKTFTAKLVKTYKGKKKYKVIVTNGKQRTIRFGATGYSDYTLHKDPERKERYIKRHQKNEDWDDPYTAGFWSRWLLWNKPSIAESKKDISERFNIQFI